MTPENLTLRDYFAAHAMNSLINSKDIRWTAHDFKIRKELANEAYAVAENMLAYRKTLHPVETDIAVPQTQQAVKETAEKNETDWKTDFKKKLHKK